MNKLLERYGLAPRYEDIGSAKSGYQLSTNHWYYEVNVDKGKFKYAQEVIRFFAQCCLDDPVQFLGQLDLHMESIGKPALPIQKPPAVLAGTSSSDLQLPPIET